MEVTFKNLEIKFEISEDCIDFYVNGNQAGDFTIEENCGIIMIRPAAIDVELIGYGRLGIYSFVIDMILDGELNHELDMLFQDVTQIHFESVLRTEKACFFWTNRGYPNEYNEAEHNNGEQDVIGIQIASWK